MDRPDVGECWWQTEGDVKTNREAWEAITACEKRSTNRNRCPIDAGKPTGSIFQ